MSVVIVTSRGLKQTVCVWTNCGDFCFLFYGVYLLKLFSFCFCSLSLLKGGVYDYPTLAVAHNLTALLLSFSLFVVFLVFVSGFWLFSSPFSFYFIQILLYMEHQFMAFQVGILFRIFSIVFPLKLF